MFVKDRQIVNMEEKLKHAKKELDKIINTKVFSRGSQLIYELDMTTRQLRLMKDNVFTLEKKLSDKIYITFQKELDNTKLTLEETQKKFMDY